MTRHFKSKEPRRQLLATEMRNGAGIDEVVAAILEARGTSGGSTTTHHITTIRVTIVTPAI